MEYPKFYNQVPTIKLYDPLSEFLGAFEEGELEVSYLECVKLAGHSCPTVAGAYLMAQHGLNILYPNDLPKRGSIKVTMRDASTDGVTGVICNVISFIVGANGDEGFKGIKGKFSRDKLVKYNAPIQAEVQLIRLDTQESVTLSYNPSSVPADANMQLLMGKCIQELASKEECIAFGKLWQQRVENILLHTDINTLITSKKD